LNVIASHSILSTSAFYCLSLPQLVQVLAIATRAGVIWTHP
jgi:hypothetical protein